MRTSDKMIIYPLLTTWHSESIVDGMNRLNDEYILLKWPKHFILSMSSIEMIIY